MNQSIEPAAKVAAETFAAHPTTPTSAHLDLDGVMKLARQYAEDFACQRIPIGELYKAVAGERTLASWLALKAGVERLATPPTSAAACPPEYATEINRLRNVIQAACSGGLDHMIERWRVLFPDAPVPTVHKPTSAAVPAPLDAIGKLLAEAMDAAVKNGANSVSMPDEYVEIAVWLAAAAPTQPAGEQG